MNTTDNPPPALAVETPPATATTTEPSAAAPAPATDSK